MIDYKALAAEVREMRLGHKVFGGTLEILETLLEWMAEEKPAGWLHRVYLVDDLVDKAMLDTADPAQVPLGPSEVVRTVAPLFLHPAPQPQPERQPVSEQSGAQAGSYSWEPKSCPCGPVQTNECHERGCKWERDPSLVPDASRVYAPTPPAQADVREPTEAHPMLCATHYCKDCAALWRQCDDFSFTLRSQACCTACNNAPVGGQLFALTTPVAMPRPSEPTEAQIEAGARALSTHWHDSQSMSIAREESAIVLRAALAAKESK